VETIGKIRRWHRIEKLSISQIARRLGASRNTVKKYLKSNDITPKYAAEAVPGDGAVGGTIARAVA
jgi:IS30 family transposase